MPTYDYQCRECGSVAEAYNTIAERETNAPECHGPMRIAIFTAPMGFVDNMAEYRCPVTGQGITTRRQRNETMKRLGVIDANDVVRSPEQRRKDKQKKDEEMARINAEIAATVPKDLSHHMDKTFKNQLKEFVNSR